MAWEIDTVHSRAGFAVRQMTVGIIRGRFSAMRGYVHVDEQTPEHSWVDAEVDTAGIDTNNADRDAHLRSADCLDAAGYPVIAFKSIRVEHTASREYKVIGELSIHGIVRLVAFDAEFHEHGGMNGAGRAILTARTRLNPRDLGLMWGTSAEAGRVLVGETATIEIALELMSRFPVSQQRIET
jgi:polyisoprenoid-binding protein YceI